MRGLCVLMLLSAGCSRVGQTDWGPLVAVCAGAALVEAKDLPRPAPPPDDGVCPNCLGTGKVGDGTVAVTCAACDGTGRVPRAREQPRSASFPTPSHYEVMHQGRLWRYVGRNENAEHWLVKGTRGADRWEDFFQPVPQADSTCASGSCSVSQCGRWWTRRRR